MSRPQIAWDAECPFEVRVAAQPFLDELLPYAPRWLLELRLGWNGNCAGAAESKTHPEYRWARINFGPGWLETEFAGRRETVLHEIVHVYLHSLVLCAHAAVDAVDLPDTAAKVLREQIRVHMEGAVSDVTHALLDAIDRIPLAPAPLEPMSG